MIQDKDRETLLPRWVLLPLAVIEIILLFSLSFWIYFTRSVETYRVPDITGEKIKLSRDFLAKKGYKYRVEWRSSLKTPQGVILTQLPSPGAEIKENRTITLYVSEGPEYIEVPDLRGKSLTAARNYIVQEQKEAESIVGPLVSIGNIARVHSEAVPEDHVILQEPRPGKRVLRGAQLALLVSRGNWPRTTVVPAVKGRDLSEARKLLHGSELKLGDVNHTLKPDSPPSTVLAQTPPPHRVVAPGQRVALTVNLSEQRVDTGSTRYSLFRISPPRTLVPGQLEARLIDEQGERIVYNREVPPGKQVEFVAAFTGKSRLQIYWNDELFKIRELEASR